MEQPNVLTEVIDSESKCTIQIFAYRKLTGIEVKQAVHLWLRNNRKKTLPRNGVIKIISIHGFDD